MASMSARGIGNSRSTCFASSSSSTSSYKVSVQRTPVTARCTKKYGAVEIKAQLDTKRSENKLERVYASGSAMQKVTEIVTSPKVWQTAVAAQFLIAGSAHADAGKLFDFDLTLPVMAGQFLLLMKFLDSKVFTPVGNTIDERSKGVKAIRAALSEKQEAKNATASESKELLDKGRLAADMYVKSVKKQKMQEVEDLVAEQKKVIEADIAVSVGNVQAKLKLAEQKLQEEKPTVIAAILERLIGPPRAVKAAETAAVTPTPIADEVKEPATVEV